MTRIFLRKFSIRTIFLAIFFTNISADFQNPLAFYICDNSAQINQYFSDIEKQSIGIIRKRGIGIILANPLKGN